MNNRIWIGKFPDSEEKRGEKEQFIKLAEIVSRINNAYLFTYLTSNKYEIDAVIFYRNSIRVIELKSYSGIIKGGIHDDWYCLTLSGKSLKIRGRSLNKNPFEQISNNSIDFLNFLNKYRRDFFSDIPSRDRNISVTGIIIFNEKSDTSKVDLRDLADFYSVISIDKLENEIVKDTRSTDSHLRFSINSDHVIAMANKIGLKPGSLDDLEKKYKDSIFSKISLLKPYLDKLAEQTDYQTEGLIRQKYFDTLSNDKVNILIGNPGSGKTWILHQITNKFAKEIVSIHNITQNAPILIDCKKLGGDIYENIISEIGLSGDDLDIFKNSLMEGYFAFILDGLDEIRKESNVINILAKFVKQHSRNLFIISSRPDNRILEKFLDHFEENQVNKIFVNELSRNEQKVIIEYENPDTEESVIDKQIVEMEPDLKIMGKYPINIPILLNAITKGGVTHRNQSRKYKDHFDKLIDREIKKSSSSILDSSLLMRYMRNLAYGFLSKHSLYFDFSDTADLLVEYDTVSHETSVEIINLLLNMNILIRQEGVIEFRNLLFLDFFGGTYIAKKFDKEQSVNDFLNFWWDEALVFAAGLVQENIKFINILNEYDNKISVEALLKSDADKAKTKEIKQTYFSNALSPKRSSSEATYALTLVQKYRVTEALDFLLETDVNHLKHLTNPNTSNYLLYEIQEIFPNIPRWQEHRNFLERLKRSRGTITISRKKIKHQEEDERRYMEEFEDGRNELIGSILGDPRKLREVFASEKFVENEFDVEFYDVIEELLYSKDDAEMLCALLDYSDIPDINKIRILYFLLSSNREYALSEDDFDRIEYLRKYRNDDMNWFHALVWLIGEKVTPKIADILLDRFRDSEEENIKLIYFLCLIYNASNQRVESVLRNLFKNYTPNGQFSEDIIKFIKDDSDPGVELRDIFIDTLEPGDPQIFYKACSLVALCDLEIEDSRNLVKDALELSDKNLTLYRALGWSLSRVGQYEDIRILKEISNQCEDDITKNYCNDGITRLKSLRK